MNDKKSTIHSELQNKIKILRDNVRTYKKITTKRGKSWWEGTDTNEEFIANRTIYRTVNGATLSLEDIKSFVELKFGCISTPIKLIKDYGNGLNYENPDIIIWKRNDMYMLTEGHRGSMGFSDYDFFSMMRYTFKNVKSVN